MRDEQDGKADFGTRMSAIYMQKVADLLDQATKALDRLRDELAAERQKREAAEQALAAERSGLPTEQPLTDQPMDRQIVLLNRQVGALRDALAYQSNECSTCHPGQPCPEVCVCSCDRCHAEAAKRDALSGSSTSDYVPRSELDAANRQVAAMRDAIREFRKHAHYPHGAGYGGDDSVSVEKKLAFIAANKMMDAALSASSASDYVSKADVRPLVEALRHAVNECFDCRGRGMIGKPYDRMYASKPRPEECPFCKPEREALALATKLGLEGK
jgi:hypothetical protein